MPNSSDCRAKYPISPSEFADNPSKCADSLAKSVISDSKFAGSDSDDAISRSKITTRGANFARRHELRDVRGRA